MKTKKEYPDWYVRFAKAMVATYRDLIEKWAKDESDPETAANCRFLLGAAGAVHK